MIIDSPIISGSYAASGSLNQFGNVTITGSLTVTGDITGTALTATSASYALTASHATNVPQTSSFADNATSASYAVTASYISGSGAGVGFPYSGSAVITGSLLITELSGSGTKYVITDNNGLLSISSGSTAIKVTEAITSTTNQTSFVVPNGYTTGLVDVFINGIKLNDAEFTDNDGVTITLATGSNNGDVVEFAKYQPANGVTNNALRQQTTFTATAGQTVFSASYTPGLIDIFYNGSKLTSSDFIANNGTYFTLATASAADDILDVFVYSYQVGAFSGIAGAGVPNQVAYFGLTNDILGSNNLKFDGSTLLLTGSLTISGSSTFTNIGPAVFSGSITALQGISGTASLASTASSADNFLVRNTLTAQTLVVQTITSSVDFVTGSTKFGTLLTNTHVFSGSVTMNPGGLFVSGSGNVSIGITPQTDKLFVYNASGANTGLTIQQDGTGDILRVNGNSGSNRFNITQAGAATFSNSVTLARPSSGATLLTLLGTDAYGDTSTINLCSGRSFIKSTILVTANGDTDITFGTQSGGVIAEKMKITSGGTLQLGTYSGNTDIQLTASTVGYSSILFGDGASGSDTYRGYLQYQHNGDYMLFATSAIERMRITSVGRGLFGTQTPSAGSSGFSVNSFQVKDEVISIGSLSGFFWENRSGGVTTNSNWYGWYTTAGTIFLYNGAGNIASINGTSGAYTALSDINKKKDIELYTNNGLNAILGLKPTLYRMKEEDESVNKHLGFIAQEVKDFIPEAYVETIAEEKDGGVHIGLDYQAITVNLVKAIQEQQALITELQEKLERNNII